MRLGEAVVGDFASIQPLDVADELTLQVNSAVLELVRGCRTGVPVAGRKWWKMEKPSPGAEAWVSFG
jgi:hypothetical protein